MCCQEEKSRRKYKLNNFRMKYMLACTKNRIEKSKGGFNVTAFNMSLSFNSEIEKKKCEEEWRMWGDGNVLPFYWIKQTFFMLLSSEWNEWMNERWRNVMQWHFFIVENRQVMAACLYLNATQFRNVSERICIKKVMKNFFPVAN